MDIWELTLKVLSYWNLNEEKKAKKIGESFLKVLSYWNLNMKNSE